MRGITKEAIMDWVYYQATEEELLEMNKVVVYAIRAKRAYRDRREAMKYAEGDVVSFAHKGRLMTGTVRCVNAKTLSLENCSDGRKWRVGYGCVQ